MKSIENKLLAAQRRIGEMKKKEKAEKHLNDCINRELEEERCKTNRLERNIMFSYKLMTLFLNMTGETEVRIKQEDISNLKSDIMLQPDGKDIICRVVSKSEQQK